MDLTMMNLRLVLFTAAQTIMAATSLTAIFFVVNAKVTIQLHFLFTEDWIPGIFLAHCFLLVNYGCMMTSFLILLTSFSSQEMEKTCFYFTYDVVSSILLFGLGTSHLMMTVQLYKFPYLAAGVSSIINSGFFACSACASYSVRKGVKYTTVQTQTPLAPSPPEYSLVVPGCITDPPPAYELNSP